MVRGTNPKIHSVPRHGVETHVDTVSNRLELIHLRELVGQPCELGSQERLRHEQHGGKRVGTLLDLDGSPRSAGLSEGASALAVEQHMA